MKFYSLFFNWAISLTKSDWILLLTLIAIVLYTIETYKLRKWQQKSVQISLLDLRQRILMHQNEMFSKGAQSDRNIFNIDVINIMNDILEEGKFDFKKLFAPGIVKERKRWFKKN